MLRDFIKTKRLLITGGTGSLGHALVKELIPLNPAEIKIYSRGELLQAQMKKDYPDLRYIIGDVRDTEMLWRAANKVDYIIHTAALKRIETCEANPQEAISTNVKGTINVIDAALKRSVIKVISIDSDKSVHPISVYGTTKLVASRLVITANTHGDTKFSCVRLGNFEGSRGSFITMMENQVANNELITITDKDMTRFWITLENAAKFTLGCLGRMNGGEIFIPKMSEQDIMDIVNKFAPEKPFKIIGKRPGEKLHELLFAEGEKPIDCGDYFVIRNSNGF